MHGRRSQSYTVNRTSRHGTDLVAYCQAFKAATSVEFSPSYNAMNSYTIHEVNTRTELDALVDVVWAAWWNPYMLSTRIARPIFGNSAADKARAITASKERYWNDFIKSQDPGTAKDRRIWLFAKHAESGETVGGVVLNFAQVSPFPNGRPQLNLQQWPEGEEAKAFCEEMMNQVYTPRSMWMQRPHGGMWNFAVHPHHRGRGVGQLLLEYNNKELDALGIEGFVEATELGRPAYEKAGFQVAMKVNSYIPAGKSDDWQKWYHEMGVSPWYAMWRPKGGKVEAGERTKPWQQGIVIPID